jgi:hypothetical protein
MKDQTVRMPQIQSLTIQGLPNGGNGPGRLVWPTIFFTRYPDLEELCLSNMDLRPQAMQESLDLSIFSCLRSVTMHQISIDKFPALPPSLEISQLSRTAKSSRSMASTTHGNGSAASIATVAFDKTSYNSVHRYGSPYTITFSASATGG